MPVFDRYKIERYKEILINQPAGLVSDGGFSTYSLDDPSVTPNGTGDFLGVIKTVILLAEVYKETIDTRNISFAQFNNLTQQEFDNYISQGLILRNRENNGREQRIGWVEIGRSHASFYYQSCPNGKRPISEHYYDISEFTFDNKTVIGDGPEIEPTDALTPVGNFDPNIVNNLGVLRPRFNPLNLVDYVRFAISGVIINNDGESVRINDFALTDQNRPTQVSLLMANKADHFDNQFATEISTGKWGVVRRTISESLKPGVKLIYPRLGSIIQQNPYELDFSINQGECLDTSTVSSVGGEVIIRDDGSTLTTSDVGVGVTVPDLPTLTEWPIDQWPLSDRWDNPKIIGISSNRKLETVGPMPPVSSSIDITWTAGTQNRSLYQTRGVLDGWRDPRSIVNENIESPPGEIYGSFNQKTDEYVIKPAVIREPIITSIQNKVGSTRASLSDVYRRNCFKMYRCNINSYNITQSKIGNYIYSKPKPIFVDEQLVFSLGYDEVGNAHYSDSDSFRERCIFTGYNKSFENRIFVSLNDIDNDRVPIIEREFWNDISIAIKTETWQNKKTSDISATIKSKDGRVSTRNFPVTYISKSKRYFTSSPPINTLFLGYYEEDIFNGLSKDIKRPRMGTTSKDLPRPGNKIYGDYGTKYTNPFSYKNDGTFRDILMDNVYKNDVILKKVIVGNDSGISLKKNITIPKLAHRSELYGPNPFQHILYADFLFWDKYLTNYNFNWTRNIDPNEFDLKVGRGCGDFIKQYGWRSVPISDRFEKPNFAYSEDYPNFYWIEIQDKTRILDVYFGLMEMHIKGYPWSVIFKVMDKLPNGYREYPNMTEVEEASIICGDLNYFSNAKKKYTDIVKSFDAIWEYMVQNKFVTPFDIQSDIGGSVVSTNNSSV